MHIYEPFLTLFYTTISPFLPPAPISPISASDRGRGVVCFNEVWSRVHTHVHTAVQTAHMCAQLCAHAAAHDDPGPSSINNLPKIS